MHFSFTAVLDRLCDEIMALAQAETLIGEHGPHSPQLLEDIARRQALHRLNLNRFKLWC